VLEGVSYEGEVLPGGQKGGDRVTTEPKHRQLLAKLRRAKDAQKKAKIWHDADLSGDEVDQVVRAMVLSLPKIPYKLHDREYGTNLVDAVYETYGWMPSMFVSESMMLGLQALYPDKVYASFTHNLDAVELKSPRRPERKKTNSSTKRVTSITVRGIRQ
jgi:hypothetical protein